MQLNYAPDGTATATLEDGARAYPCDENGVIRGFHLTCTFTDGLEEAPVVDEKRTCVVIRVGDEEMIVYKPRFQHIIDELFPEEITHA